MTVMNKVLKAVLAAAVLAAAAGTASSAAADPVDLSVIDRDAGGQTLGIWRSGGRHFVAGRPGARYALRLSNTTGQRVLVVLSVDGVNILSGETAAYNQRGYILSPYESYEVSGWRKSESSVAAFTFTALSNSYAARTGRPNDVGVIGMAVFNERTRPAPAVSSRPPTRAPVPPPIPVPVAPSASVAQNQAPMAAGRGGARADLAAPGPAQEMARTESLGTGHGAIEQSYVTIQPFERATSAPFFIRQIEYDSQANLIARGIIPPPQPARQPRPFPGAGFVPDPPRY